MDIENAVVLLSGGLDSATCLAIAARDHEIHALTIDYGSRHSRELDSARAIAAHYRIASHTVLKVELDAIGGSSLTDESSARSMSESNVRCLSDFPFPSMHPYREVP